MSPSERKILLASGAAAGMAATFGAATRATFTAIVFLFELTRDYRSILPLMLATVLAELVASRWLRERIMTEQMITEEVDHLPVIGAGGQLVGICTRTDILRARGRQLAEERLQPGWLSPLLRRGR